MVTLTYTYEDYNGNNRTEELFFNLTEAEATKMEVSTEGGLSAKIKRIVAAQNIGEIMKVFDELIMASYGEKSPDGRRFIKSPELSKAFMETEAYNMLFMDFVTKEGFAAQFFNNLVKRTGVSTPAQA